MKMNWVIFSNYKMYKEYIFIGFRDTASIIGVDKRWLSKDDLENLFNLLKAKDIQKLN